jgi:hypothetical protein
MQSMLPPGILSTSAGIKLGTVEDYSDEIREDIPLPPNGIVNRNREQVEIMEAFTTKKGKTLLLGEVGTGKSTLIGATLRILSGTVPLEDLVSEMPEAKTLVPRMQKTLQRYQHRDFIFLPDFFDPINFHAVPYTDDALATQDFKDAEDFAEEIGLLFTDYTSDVDTYVGRRFDEKGYRQRIRYEVDRLYFKFFESLYAMNQVKKTDLNAVSLIRLQLPKDLEDTIEGSWELLYHEGTEVNPNDPILLSFTGYRSDKKRTLDAVVKQLNDHAFKMQFSFGYRAVVERMKVAEVDGVGNRKKKSIFRQEFQKRADQLYKELKAAFESGEVQEDEDMNLLLHRVKTPQQTKTDVASWTLNELNDNLIRLRADVQKRDYSPAIMGWADKLCRYFIENPRVIYNAMVNMLRLSDDFEFSVSSQARKKEMHNIDFEVTFGPRKYPIGNVLQPNYFGTETASTGGMSWIKFSTDPSFFMKYADGGHTVNTPPHNKIVGQGVFFTAGILATKDRFRDFIQQIVNNSQMGGARLSMEDLLEYFETSVISLTYEGTTFHMELPKFFIAADTANPFITNTDGVLSYQDGLEDRIHTIEVSPIIRNTPESRRGTIAFIYNYAKEINARSDHDIKLTKEAANLILQRTMVSPDYLDLHYRRLQDFMDKIYAHADGKEISEITCQVIRDWKRTTVSSSFFELIEREREFGGYFSQPEATVGRVNGLMLIAGSKGAMVPVESYTLKRDGLQEETRYSLRDADSKLADETMQKGFMQATDYIRRLLDFYNVMPAGCDDDWIMKTNLRRNYQGIGGPSASLAMTISMLSALFNMKVYNNIFITGTVESGGSIDSTDSGSAGEVGPIGGTYSKGMVPLVLGDMARQQRKDDAGAFYYLFPASNIWDLTLDLATDPFDLGQKVTCLPVLDVQQAFYLATCGPVISEENWENSRDLGRKLIEEQMGLLRQKYTGSAAGNRQSTLS